MLLDPLRITSAVAAAVVSLPMAAHAELPDYPMSAGYVIVPYEQCHFALQSFDDGETRTTNLVDITNANTRIGFYIQPDEADTALSYQFETGLGFRPSSATSHTTTPDLWDWSHRDLRKVQFI